MCAECVIAATKPSANVGISYNGPRCAWCGKPTLGRAVTLSNEAVTWSVCGECAEGTERKHIDTQMERTRLAERVNELQRKVAAMACEYNALRDENEQLAQDAQGSTAAKLRAVWSNTIAQNAKSACAAAQLKVESLTAERDTLREQLAKTTKDCNDVYATARGLLSGNHDLLLEIDALKADVSRLTDELERAQGKVRDLTACNDEQAATICALRAKVVGK